MSVSSCDGPWNGPGHCFRAVASFADDGSTVTARKSHGLIVSCWFCRRVFGRHGEIVRVLQAVVVVVVAL